MLASAEKAKERPMLFSRPMVRAILDGRKIMTRRIIKDVRPVEIDGRTVDCIDDWDGLPSRLDSAPENWEICPHRVAGDWLWVRETWAAERQYDVLAPRDIPSTSAVWYSANSPATDSVSPGCRRMGKRRPSIFLLRWASRITVEITNVRVERLTSISSADCIAEGLSATMRNEAPAKERFRDLWDSINGKRPGCGWTANPWVWVISFRRLES